MEHHHRQIPAQSLNGPILVADIGGTHVRFAVVDVANPPPWELQARDLRAIGPEVRGAPGGSLTILRAATGFGVSCLARNGDPDRAVVLATGGGSAAFVKSIPTQLIVNPDAALLGAACAARRKGG